MNAERKAALTELKLMAYALIRDNLYNFPEQDAGEAVQQITGMIDLLDYIEERWREADDHGD